MKMNRLQIGCIAVVCAFLFLGNVQAVTVVLNGANGSNLLTNSPTLGLGTIISGVQGQFGGQAERDAYMVNNLITLGLGGTTNAFGDGSEYHRSMMPPASLPMADITGAVLNAGLATGSNAFGAIVSLTLPAMFQYLVVVYDGPNGGAIVYDVSSLAAGTVIQMATVCPTCRSCRFAVP